MHQYLHFDKIALEDQGVSLGGSSVGESILDPLEVIHTCQFGEVHRSIWRSKIHKKSNFWGIASKPKAPSIIAKLARIIWQ